MKSRNMLRFCEFPRTCSSNPHHSLPTKPNTSPLSLSFPLSPPPQRLCQTPTHLRLRARRTDSLPPWNNTTKSKKKRVKGPTLETENFGLMLGLGALDEEGDEEFEDEDEDEDGDESVSMPLERMKKWLENRPRGFGEGKVYDTRIEEQLLEEMRQSQEAQVANIAKLKSESLEPNKKGDEIVPSGVRVRVTNLPRKKNVHRDLSAAFKEVSGMISINPVVNGNKKTRDPICKGFAFVYFKSEKDAHRFVEMFSRKSILFGKIQKQIRCEIVGSKSSDTELEKEYAETTNANRVSEVEVEVVEEDQSSDYYSDEDDSFVGEFDNTVFVEFDMGDDDEDDGEDFEAVTELELNDNGSFEQIPVTRLRVKDKSAKVPKSKRNNAAKGKAPKLVIPGSAKRLKVKEKAVLTDVFSKYGKKQDLVSKKER